MIDLSKKYTCDKHKVHLYDILDGVVYGKYYDERVERWFFDRWLAETGQCTAPGHANFNLVEVPSFRLISVNNIYHREMHYFGHTLYYVPDWVKYIATNPNGDIYGYGIKPSNAPGNGWHAMGAANRRSIRLCESAYVGEWQDSLLEL